MLFFFHQEPPPKPPATVQVVQAVQKSQDAAATHSSLVGPPKSLMTSTKIDFQKFEKRLYVETVVIEGEAEAMLKKPVNYMVTLPDGRIIWGRHIERPDMKYARMIPFWMDRFYSNAPQYFGYPVWNFPMGWGY
jgi:hypothetical protein